MKSLPGILVLAYKFPPYAGVGGFRWSKLAKYLARRGHDVHVLTVDWPQAGTNSLVEDVVSERIVIHRVRPPRWFTVRHTPVASRIGNVTRSVIMSRVVDRVAYWDDETQGWGETLARESREILDEHGLKVVIATGHPFQAVRHAAELKRRDPLLTFIADLRDPWFQQRMHSLGARRSSIVEAWARETLEMADLTVCVTDGLAQLYRQLSKDVRCVTIPNGVDTEALPPLRARPRWDFVYTGNVTNGRDVPARAFLESLARIAKDSRVLFVGDNIGPVSSFRGRLPNLVCAPAVTQREAFALVADARFGLHLNATHVPYLVSTKIYEYPAIGVPVISFNCGGDSTVLLRENGWGESICLGTDDVDSRLGALLQSQSYAVAFNPAYSYDTISALYSQTITGLVEGETSPE